LKSIREQRSAPTGLAHVAIGTVSAIPYKGLVFLGGLVESVPPFSRAALSHLCLRPSDLADFSRLCDIMQTSQEYRGFVVKLVDANPHKPKPKVRFDESWETLVLGLASSVIGLTMLSVVVMCFMGRRVNGLTDERIAGWNRDNTPIKYPAPNRASAIAAVAGECLGLAGIVLGRWRRMATSVLCVLGTLICLLDMLVFYVHVFVAT
jgi:hypothetical protein